MKFEKVHDTVYKTKSQSREGVFHYIALFENPMFEPMKDAIIKRNNRRDLELGNIARQHDQLITCTCESFRMGIPRGGGNPFVEGCVHVKAFKKQSDLVVGDFDHLPKKKKAKKKKAKKLRRSK